MSQGSCDAPPPHGQEDSPCVAGMIDCSCFLFSMASPAPVADLRELHRSGDASYIAFVEMGKTARRTRGLALVQERQQLRS